MLAPRLKEPFTTELRKQDAWLLHNDTGAGIVDLANPRHVNVGITEMTVCGMASGMAAKGVKVYTAAIACHYIRAWELIRTLVVPEHLDVGFIGTGMGDDYASLGYSHMTPQKQMESLCHAIGLRYYIPEDPNHLIEIMRMKHPRFIHFSRDMHL